jgi:hypothetical protein
MFLFYYFIHIGLPSEMFFLGYLFDMFFYLLRIMNLLPERYSAHNSRSEGFFGDICLLCFLIFQGLGICCLKGVLKLFLCLQISFYLVLLLALSTSFLR